MSKIVACVVKEFRLIKRDYGGLLLLFAMPLFLVLVMTLLQESTFNSINEKRIKVALLNADQSLIGNSFKNGLEQSSIFQIQETVDGRPFTPADVKEVVANGKFNIGIVVPEQTTKQVKSNVLNMVSRQLPDFIRYASDSTLTSSIEIYYDPTTKPAFKQAISSSLNSHLAKVENQILLKTYANVISAITNLEVPEYEETPAVVSFHEQYASSLKSTILPNAVQHNIPAWTLFAMFFICIPLSANLISERQQASIIRLTTLPVSKTTLLLGKVIVYVVICLLQALLIFAVGKFIMPLLGLPSLQFGNHHFILVLFTLCCALAATGLGVAIGTLFKSNIQAGATGSVLVMIMAAIGGIWVPVYLMPNVMRQLSAVSPLNWGITGYYDLFIRNGSFFDVLPQMIKLVLFFITMLLIAAYFYKRNK